MKIGAFGYIWENDSSATIVRDDGLALTVDWKALYITLLVVGESMELDFISSPSYTIYQPGIFVLK